MLRRADSLLIRDAEILLPLKLDTYSHIILGIGDYTARAMEVALEEDSSEEKGKEDASEG